MSDMKERATGGGISKWCALDHRGRFRFVEASLKPAQEESAVIEPTHEAARQAELKRRDRTRTAVILV